MSDEQFQALTEQIKSFDPANVVHREWLMEKRKRDMVALNTKAAKAVRQLLART